MTDFTAASEDAALDAIITTSTGYFLSLHTADPGQTGASEGTDGRQSITFGTAAAAGSKASTTAQTWASAVGGQTYSFYGIWTLATGGTYKCGGPLTANITPPAASQITVAVGAISFTAS